MTTTPWALYVTPDKQLVRCYVDPDKTYLHVAAGNPSGPVRTCRIRAHTRLLEFQENTGAAWRPLEPHTLPLQRWLGSSGLLTVKLNVLAIPHLIVTEQIPLEGLLRAISGAGSLSTGWHILLTQDCPLLRSLGRSEVFVLFGTHYDFSVARL